MSKRSRLALRRRGTSDGRGKIRGRQRAKPVAELLAQHPRWRFLDGARFELGKLKRTKRDANQPCHRSPRWPSTLRTSRFAAEAPRKLQLLGRGLGVFGTYAKLLLIDGEAAGYCQFGPLSAYPRALRLRQLYPKLPDAPLPAVITCIATTAAARRGGHALRLVEGVCVDLAGRGFAAVEAYPERSRGRRHTGGSPEFSIAAGFHLAVDDDRYPVVRREL